MDLWLFVYQLSMNSTMNTYNLGTTNQNPWQSQYSITFKHYRQWMCVVFPQTLNQKHDLLWKSWHQEQQSPTKKEFRISSPTSNLLLLQITHQDQRQWQGMKREGNRRGGKSKSKTCAIWWEESYIWHKHMMHFSYCTFILFLKQGVVSLKRNFKHKCTLSWL